jgi:polar amino acid transport system substrate-binding protein
MKKISCFMVALLFFCFFCPASGSTASGIDKILKKKELVVGTSGTYPPLTFKAKDGNAHGLDADLARAIADAMGVKLRLRIIPFDELIPALLAGKIDMIISCMTVTPERNLRVAFIGPYFVSGQSILTTKEVAAGINSPSDINNPEFTVAVPKGTTTEVIAKGILPKADLKVVKSTDEALELLKNQKVKAVMADYPFVAVEAFRYQDRGFVANPPFSSEPLGIAVRPDDLHLLNFLSNFIGQMRMGGHLDALTKRWFTDPAWMSQLP